MPSRVSPSWSEPAIRRPHERDKYFGHAWGGVVGVRGVFLLMFALANSWVCSLLRGRVSAYTSDGTRLIDNRSGALCGPMVMDPPLPYCPAGGLRHRPRRGCIFPPPRTGSTLTGPVSGPWHGGNVLLSLSAFRASPSIIVVA